MCFCLVFSCFLFFFFKQKTAYEMRISDWSSDVCSSDLPPQPCALCPVANHDLAAVVAERSDGEESRCRNIDLRDDVTILCIEQICVLASIRRQQSATIGTEDDDPDIVFDAGRRQTYLPFPASTLQVPQPHFAISTACQTFTVRRECVGTTLVALELPRYRGGLLQIEQLDTAIEQRCSEMAATGIDRKSTRLNSSH